jgi:hypothetical protein
MRAIVLLLIRLTKKSEVKSLCVAIQTKHQIYVRCITLERNEPYTWEERTLHFNPSITS